MIATDRAREQASESNSLHRIETSPARVKGKKI
jgi:hypothetical protein